MLGTKIEEDTHDEIYDKFYQIHALKDILKAQMSKDRTRILQEKRLQVLNKVSKQIQDMDEKEVTRRLMHRNWTWLRCMESGVWSTSIANGVDMLVWVDDELDVGEGAQPVRVVVSWENVEDERIYMCDMVMKLMLELQDSLTNVRIFVTFDDDELMSQCSKRWGIEIKACAYRQMEGKEPLDDITELVLPVKKTTKAQQLFEQIK
jgi:hypothetical protein